MLVWHVSVIDDRGYNGRQQRTWSFMWTADKAWCARNLLRGAWLGWVHRAAEKLDSALKDRRSLIAELDRVAAEIVVDVAVERITTGWVVPSSAGSCPAAGRTALLVAGQAGGGIGRESGALTILLTLKVRLWDVDVGDDVIQVVKPF